MKIVIDFQACQTASKYRGVGRYSLSLARELVPLLLAMGHEVVFLFNKLFDDKDDAEQLIRGCFGSSVDIAWFGAKGPVTASSQDNAWRLRAAEVLREAKLIALGADLVHIASLLPEGWVDNFVVSIGHLPTAARSVVTHYDLIPAVMPQYYLPDRLAEEYYQRKMEWIKKADLFLCISEYTKREAGEFFKVSSRKLVSISSAVGDEFVDYEVNLAEAIDVLSRFSLDKKKFLLYAPGGFDYRKNLNRLIEAYAELPPDLQRRHPLVIASKLAQGLREAWTWKAGDAGVEPDCFILTDYVSDEHLRVLYANCHAYVFPSLHEGFGLPVLEAMACGAPVIASNVTSIPEVIGNEPDALFDPYDVTDIRNSLLRIVSDSTLHARLKVHSKMRATSFSWQRTAALAADAIRRLPSHKRVSNATALPSAAAAIDIVNSLAGRVGGADDRSSFIDEYTKILEGAGK